MIFEALDRIQKELNPVVSSEIGNIGEILANNSHVSENNIIISLINIEENRISRDPKNFVRNDTGIMMKNPAIHLNLTLLFTSVKHDAGYQQALQHIQHVIGFFQSKAVFDHSNTPDLDDRIEKLNLEMVSLNLEQLHQLWSMLGGRYHPSVAYKMRMITIDSVSGLPGSPIREIETNYFRK
jgi:hypothetical protein